MTIEESMNEPLVETKFTHMDRFHYIEHTPHEPSICNKASTCPAALWCGHAKIHTHELMYEKCSGRFCHYLLNDVACIEPTEEQKHALSANCAVV